MIHKTSAYHDNINKKNKTDVEMKYTCIPSCDIHPN